MNERHNALQLALPDDESIDGFRASIEELTLEQAALARQGVPSRLRIEVRFALVRDTPAT